jgi:hypothetical protein
MHHGASCPAQEGRAGGTCYCARSGGGLFARPPSRLNDPFAMLMSAAGHRPSVRAHRASPVARSGTSGGIGFMTQAYWGPTNGVTGGVGDIGRAVGNRASRRPSTSSSSRPDARDRTVVFLIAGWGLLPPEGPGSRTACC